MLESHEITRLESDKPPRGKSFSGLCRSAFGPQLRDPHATYAPSTDNLNALSSQGAYGHPLGGADYSFDSLSVNVSVQGLGMGLDGVVSDMGSSSPKSTERKAHHALRSHIENARSLHISDKLSSIGAAITVAAGGLLEASRSKYELKSKQEEESRKSPPQSWKSPEEPRRSHEESRRSHEESRRSHEESRRSHEESRRSHEESWRSHEESRRSQEGSMHRAQNPPDAAARLPLVLDAEVEQLVKELDDMADTQIQEHSAIQKRLKQKQTEYIDKQREMCTQLQEDQKTFWAGLANKWASQASAVALKGAEAEQTGLEQICKSLKDAGLSLAVEALLSGTSLAAAPGLAISKAGEASATSDESGPKHPPVNAEKEQDVKAEADARPPDETKPEGKPDDGPAPPYGRRGSSSYMDNGPTREASTSSPVQSPMAYRVRIKDDRGSVRARGDPNGLRPRPAPSDDGRAPSPKNSDSPPPVDRKMVRRGSVTQDPKNNITFKKGAQIGSGGFGVVFIGLNDQTGELLAIKNIPFDSTDKQIHQKLKELQKEIAVMKSLTHPNIVRYFQTAREGSSINIFMEYVPGGSIANLLKQFGPLKEKVCKSYSIQILNGLIYLHEKGVVHRDIKGANILLGVDGMCKLADFGAAGILDDIAAQNLKSLKGTPYWMAPEVITQSGHAWQADIWSLGCTVMEMLTAAPPFQHVSRSQLSVMHFIVDDKWDITVPEGLSETVSDFLLVMLKREPEQRESAVNLLRHPYLCDDGGADSPISPLYSTLRMTSAAAPPESERSESPKHQSPAPAEPTQKMREAQAEMEKAAALEAEREKEIARQREQRDKEGKYAQKVIESIRATCKSKSPGAKHGEDSQPSSPNAGSRQMTYRVPKKTDRSMRKSSRLAVRSPEPGGDSPGSRNSSAMIDDAADSPPYQRAATAPA